MNRLIDPSVLEQLQLSIGKESLPLVLNTFISQGDENLEQINTGLTCGALSSLCHSLKSSAASIGALRLSKEAERIYDEIKLNPSEPPPETETLSALLKTTLIALHTHLR